MSAPGPHAGRPAQRALLACVTLLLACASGARVDLAPTPFTDPDTGLAGYRDASGRVVIPARYAVAGRFSVHGLAAVADDTGWAYIDRHERVVIRPFVVDNGPDLFREGLARYERGGRFGYFNERGRIVITARFDFALPFSDGLAVFCTGCRAQASGEHALYAGGRWGYIDHAGRAVIAPRFERAEPFVGGQARVRVDGSWHWIDTAGAPLQAH